MKKINLFFSLLAAAGFAALYTGFYSCQPAAAPKSTCESFDCMPNDRYGTSTAGVVTHPPGTTIFWIPECVPVKIQDHMPPSGPFSGFVGIETAPAAFGSGNVVNTNNANIEIDFSGKNVTMLSVEFITLGGTENLAVNGASYVGDITAAPATLGGASVSVVKTPVPGGKTGKITITAASGATINNFLIGGQEFYFDNLCYQ